MDAIIATAKMIARIKFLRFTFAPVFQLSNEDRLLRGWAKMNSHSKSASTIEL